MDRVQCLDDVLRTYELVLARDTNRLALLEMQIDPRVGVLSLGDVLVRIDERFRYVVARCLRRGVCTSNRFPMWAASIGSIANPMFFSSLGE